MVVDASPVRDKVTLSAPTVVSVVLSAVEGEVSVTVIPEVSECMCASARVMVQAPAPSVVQVSPVCVVGSVLAVFTRSATFGKKAMAKAVQSSRPNSADIPFKILIVFLVARTNSGPLIGIEAPARS